MEIQPGSEAFCSPTDRPSVLILGAGPAGLSLGHELWRRGLSFLILERGETAGDSWRQMPSAFKLVSPWKTNRLPGSAPRLFPAHGALSAADYFGYLKRYAAESRWPIFTDVEVVSVRQSQGGFVVAATRCEWTVPVVVNATGYFANPYVPTLSGAAQSIIPQLHYASFQSAEKARQMVGKRVGRILIVGKRLSAGQIMVELADKGFEVGLSFRPPLEFGPEPLRWWIIFRVLPWIEWWKLRAGAHTQKTNVPMLGGRTRQLIERNVVKVFPPINRFEERQIVFSDGARWEPDLVIYATGFRPALRHLAPLALTLNPQTGLPRTHGFESAEVRGLFFLGLDQLHNFQSRFLRGIRHDASLLAEQLARRRAEWAI